MDDLKELREKYEQKIKEQFNESDMNNFTNVSSEYKQFLEDNKKTSFTIYEKCCNFFSKNIPIEPDLKMKETMQKDIDTLHLQVTPGGVLGFAIIVPLMTALVLSIFLFLLTQNFVLILFTIMLAAISIFPLQSLPSFLAQSFRMKASGQQVLSIFYIVTYMRHTSNLERAIEFASQHLNAPMSLDFRKILWDVETQKYDNIFDSLENYLNNWKDYTPEFVESMHVIVGSLYESSEKKRQELLDKSLDLLLEETYDKMLHYAHNLQSPITALHMLGIVLPILGLIILPLTVNFIQGFKWYYIMILYNIVLPVAIYVMGKRILSTRPSGYGGVSIENTNEKENKTSFTIAMSIIGIGLLLSLSPVLLHILGGSDFGFGSEMPSDESCGRQFCFMGYYESTEEGSFGEIIGPYGLGATLVSLILPLFIALALWYYYVQQTKKLMVIRNETKKLEGEFTGALFQLGNRLGDGFPPEIAFSKVAQTMPDSRSGSFFRLISINIQKLGMGVNEAVFDPRVGALSQFPSTLIESSMKILTQSAQKGPAVASNAIENVARYIREMSRVNERLTDLMAEVISSMKSQVSFLTPIIAGVVLGITSMITTILHQLRMLLAEIGAEVAEDEFGGMSNLVNIFGDGIPTYYFSLIVGIYVVQVVFILSQLINSIQNGVDPVNEKYVIGMNMLKSIGLYTLISLIIILIFNVVAVSILGEIIS